mgnify:CR=1 FL=1
MLQGVNLEEIKQYNSSLKQYKDKAASLNAEIEYTNRELDSLCAELTAELGVTVTRDNVEEIYKEQIEKINSTLQSGNAVLAKIASEEQAIASGAGQQVMGVANPIPQVAQTTPPNMFTAQATMPQAPVFGGQVELPKMFNI